MTTAKSRKRELRRLRALRLTGGACFLCGKPLPKEWTRDHLLPMTLVNKVLALPYMPPLANYGFACTVPAHYECNKKKAATMPSVAQLRRFVDAHDRITRKAGVAPCPLARELADTFDVRNVNAPINRQAAAQWLHHRFTQIPGRVVLYGRLAIPADLGVNPGAPA